ncbi:Chitin bind 4 domain containing protein [Asbolus verrucosus]|uniref:Chitin bind 4 domain containing protein n=1 Tax=Asbolus verrucosus TaxID=1661398 RepID=A0A482VY13_ASBVE|nr:Chitin bind 4 domain containing protein [Asbolus verrucosus]
MKLLIKLQLILSVTVALASAGRLENTYLPPISAGSASGSSILAAQSRQFPGLASSALQIPILKLENNNDGDGTYRFSFETANNIVQQESGQLKSADSSAVRGSYSYTGPDGQTYTVNYVADENGFRPEGAHLPTPPPVPEAIVKSLQENAADEARGVVDDGQYRSSGQVAVNRQNGGFPPSSQYLPPKHAGYKR